jgi:hypothetical protein
MILQQHRAMAFSYGCHARSQPVVWLATGMPGARWKEARPQTARAWHPTNDNNHGKSMAAHDAAMAPDHWQS